MVGDSRCTVGTKIIADPKKCFQELISEKLLILLRDICLELVIVSSYFSGFVFLAGQITGISLKVINSSKKVSKITGITLARINSVIISVRTVILKALSLRTPRPATVVS